MKPASPGPILNQKRAALYCRVSTEDQAREGVSLRAQQESMLAFCKSQGWSVADIYLDDGYSASKLDRPALGRLREDAASGRFEIVLVWRLDRLTRRVLDLHLLLGEWGERVGFRSVTEVFDTTTASGRLFLTLVAAMAQWERENLVERVAWGMNQVAREGRWHGGGHIPFGYDYRDRRLVVHAEEAAVYRRMVDLYLREGWGYERIAACLNGDNAEGRIYPPKEAPRWRYTSVRQILRNPLYKGFVRHNDALYRGQHEPLIDPETWDAMQAQAHRRESSQAPKHASLLSGLLRCSECGGRMRSKVQWANWPRTPKRFHRNYVCYSYLGSPAHLVTGPCSAGYRHGPLLDRAVLDLIGELSLDEGMLDRVIAEEVAAAQPDSHATIRQVEAIEKALKEVDQRQKLYLRSFEEGTLTPDLVRGRLAELADTRQRLDRERSVLAEQRRAAEQRAICIEAIKARVESLRDGMDGLEPAELWQVVHTLLRGVWVDANGAITRVEFVID